MRRSYWVVFAVLLAFALAVMPIGAKCVYAADSGGYSDEEDSGGYGDQEGDDDSGGYGDEEDSGGYGDQGSIENAVQVAKITGGSASQRAAGPSFVPDTTVALMASAVRPLTAPEMGGLGADPIIIVASADEPAAEMKEAAPGAAPEAVEKVKKKVRKPRKPRKAGKKTYAPVTAGFVISGILCGLALGWVLQRGRFCMNSAFRDTIFIQDHTYFRAYILALIVAIVGANGLNDLGLIKLSAQPFWPFAHIVGGYIFGLGIVLAGGCGSGIWYRVGEGQLNAAVAVLGFYVGIATTMSGLFKPIYEASRKVMLLGKTPTLYSLAGSGMGIKWAVIAVLCVAMFVYVNKSKPFSPGKQKGYYWSLTGLLIGIIATVSFWLSYKYGGGFSRGLSFTTPTIEGFNTILRGDPRPTIFPIMRLGHITVTWGVFFIFAVPLGAYLSARGYKEFTWKVPPAKELLTVFGGSLMMGFGATLALGCNMGQGITGVSTLSVGSIIATLSIIAGNWTMVYFKFIKPMQDLDDIDLD